MKSIVLLGIHPKLLELFNFGVAPCRYDIDVGVGVGSEPDLFNRFCALQPKLTEKFWIHSMVLVTKRKAKVELRKMEYLYVEFPMSLLYL